MIGLPLPGVSQESDSTGKDITELRKQLAPVIVPDLTGLDDVVAMQLDEARREMEAVIAEPDADTARLAAAYGTLGQLYHAYELLDVAEVCYSNASFLSPGDFRWLHLLADVSRLAGRLEDAAARYEAAWALQPYDFAALVRLAEIYLELGRYDDSEKTFNAALALNPASPSAMAGLGQLALRKKEYGDAVMYFRAALKAAPEANRLHYSLAMAYRGLGDMDNAQRQLALRGTVGVRPPDPVVDQLQLLTEGERVHLVRGRLAFASGRFEEAADEFGAAVEADPTSARALINLGTSVAQLGDLDGAVERFQQALAIDSGQTTAHFNLGSLLVSRNQPAEAIPHLEKVVEKTPYDSEAQLLLASAYVAMGDDFSSLAPFQRASELDPGSEAAVLGGAAALVRLHQYGRATTVLDAGLQRMPASGRIAFALARILAGSPDEKVRNGERAYDLAQGVYNVEPSPRHAQLVAQSLAELGRCDEAAQWQQKVVDAAIQDGATEAVAALSADLEKYRRGAPCRLPVR
jgi:tetratricopeptide (TPR) repeat protein